MYAIQTCVSLNITPLSTKAIPGVLGTYNITNNSRTLTTIFEEVFENGNFYIFNPTNSEVFNPPIEILQWYIPHQKPRPE